MNNQDLQKIEVNKTFFVQRLTDDRLDELQDELSKRTQPDCQLKHKFTDGMYSRTILMPVGSLIVSKIHKTQHQYAVLSGSAYVKINDGKWQYIKAPWIGETQPGTRRVLITADDCIWATFHPTDKKTVEEVEQDIIQVRGRRFINQKIV